MIERIVVRMILQTFHFSLTQMGDERATSHQSDSMPQRQSQHRHKKLTRVLKTYSRSVASSPSSSWTAFSCSICRNF